MRPILVAAVPALRRWRGTGGIALQPGLNVVMIKLLRPQHPGKRLPHDRFGIVGELFGDSCSVKLFGFFLARHEQAVESSIKVVSAGNAFGALGFAGRNFSAHLTYTSLHPPKRLHVGESQLERDELTGIKFKRAVRGYLCSHLLGIDGRLVAANYIFVECV